MEMEGATHSPYLCCKSIREVGCTNRKSIPKPQSSQRLAGVSCWWVVDYGNGRLELGSIEPMDYFIDFDLGFLCFLLGHWVPPSNILT